MPVYCPDCGNEMIVVVETISNWHWDRVVEDYYDTNDINTYLLCRQCHYRINKGDFSDEITQKQRDAIERHVLGV